jgi:hypothetical protein
MERFAPQTVPCAPQVQCCCTPTKRSPNPQLHVRAASAASSVLRGSLWQMHRSAGHPPRGRCRGRRRRRTPRMWRRRPHPRRPRGPEQPGVRPAPRAPGIGIHLWGVSPFRVAAMADLNSLRIICCAHAAGLGSCTTYAGPHCMHA